MMGAEDYDSEVRFSGERAVFMGVWVLPNANSLEVIKRVRTEMAAIQRELPAGLNAKIAYDATKYIDDAIHEVLGTLTETLCIVSVVIFLFLGSFRSVLIPLAAIPMSLIGGVFLMQTLGFSLNLLTLLAIVLSVGLVVDDAIVVVENVERHVRDGKSRIDAAILGARELLGPIIAMTITLATVYTPIAFQGGLTGSLFREFALTLAGAGVLGAGAASAAAGDPYTSTPSVPTVPTMPTPTTTATTQAPPAVQGAVVTPAGENEPSGTLPVTGGDVAGMLVAAIGIVAARDEDRRERQ